MRYTGEYQIRRSREEELTIELGLAGCFLAFPGTRSAGTGAMGLSGEYRVAEAENTASPETGEVCTLILRSGYEMWLSRQMKAPAPTADADLGMTTITGDSVGVVTRGGTGASSVWPRRLCVDAGERRRGTGYQRWPWRGGAVRGRTAEALIPEGMGPGRSISSPPAETACTCARRRDRVAGQSAHPGQPDGERGALCALRELRGDGDGTFPCGMEIMCLTGPVACGGPRAGRPCWSRFSSA